MNIRNKDHSQIPDIFTVVLHCHIAVFAVSPFISDIKHSRLKELGSLQRADQFNFGLGLLIQHMSDRLKKATDDIMDAAYPKSQKAAS